MSSQTIKEHLPMSGVGTAKAASWLSLSWKKLLSHKTQLILGGGALAVLALAGYYFWGQQSERSAIHDREGRTRKSAQYSYRDRHAAGCDHGASGQSGFGNHLRTQRRFQFSCQDRAR